MKANDQHSSTILLVEEGFSEASFDSMQQINLIRRGIAKHTLSKIAEQSPISLNTLLEVLPISRRSYIKYDKDSTFSTVISERILTLVSVLTKGLDTFGSNKRFSRWLTNPVLALGEEPIHLLDTNIGCQLVLDLFTHIDHGVYS